MKWVRLFKRQRGAESGGSRDSASSGGEDGREHSAGVTSPQDQVHYQHQQQQEQFNKSLERWFKARRQRTSVDGFQATDRLSVSKDGMTTLINGKYIVVKHLGTGTFGKVKLAFNLEDQKLYAIKACRKSQLGCPLSMSRGRRLSASGRFRRAAPNRNTSLASVNSLPGQRHSDTSAGAATGVQALRERFARSWGSTMELGAAPSPSVPAAGAASSMSTPSDPSTESRPSSQRLGQAQEQRAPAAVHAPAHEYTAPDAGLCVGGGGAPVVRVVATSGSGGMGGGSILAGPAGGSGSKARPTVSMPGAPAHSIDSRSTGHVASAPPSVPSGRAGDSPFRAEDAVREIAIMKRLSHPNIVKLFEVIDDPKGDNLLLIMEYVEGHVLQPRRLGPPGHFETFSEAEVWRMARDVLLGLEYLHANHIVHGDLKPANLMLDANTRTVKIVDFGSAVMHGRSRLSSLSMMGPGTLSCTPGFRSPESLKPGYSLAYALDMWALGVTLYLWTFGELPFGGGAPFHVYESIRHSDVKLPESVCVSPAFTDFLHRLLNKDPAQRLNVDAALSHPWVTSAPGVLPEGSGALPADAGVPSAPSPPELGVESVGGAAALERHGSGASAPCLGRAGSSGAQPWDVQDARGADDGPLLAGPACPESADAMQVDAASVEPSPGARRSAAGESGVALLVGAASGGATGAGVPDGGDVPAPALGLSRAHSASLPPLIGNQGHGLAAVPELAELASASGRGGIVAASRARKRAGRDRSMYQHADSDEMDLGGARAFTEHADLSVMSNVFEEVEYQQHAELVSCGDRMCHVMLILQGEAEMYQMEGSAVGHPQHGTLEARRTAGPDADADADTCAAATTCGVRQGCGGCVAEVSAAAHDRSNAYDERPPASGYLDSPIISGLDTADGAGNGGLLALAERDELAQEFLHSASSMLDNSGFVKALHAPALHTQQRVSSGSNAVDDNTSFGRGSAGHGDVADGGVSSLHPASERHGVHTWSTSGREVSATAPDAGVAAAAPASASSPPSSPSSSSGSPPRWRGGLFPGKMGGGRRGGLHRHIGHGSSSDFAHSALVAVPNASLKMGAPVGNEPPHVRPPVHGRSNSSTAPWVPSLVAPESVEATGVDAVSPSAHSVDALMPPPSLPAPVPRGGGNGGAASEGRVVVAVMGPGDSLGFLHHCMPRLAQHDGLDAAADRQTAAQPGEPGAPVWHASVRARTRLVVLRASVAALAALVREHPELSAAVSSIAAQQETDMRVAEALRQLQAIARSQLQQHVSSPSNPGAQPATLSAPQRSFLNV